MFVLLALATASVPDYTSIMASNEEVYGVYLVARDEAAVGAIVRSGGTREVASSQGESGASQPLASDNADKEQMTTRDSNTTDEIEQAASSVKGIPLPMRQARTVKPEAKPARTKGSTRRSLPSSVSSARSPLPRGDGSAINVSTESAISAVRMGHRDGGPGSSGSEGIGGEDAVSAHALGIQPEYPLFARKHGQEGKVLFRVSFDETGGISQLSLIRSSGFTLLDSSAQKALSKARLSSWAGLIKVIAFTFELQR